MRLHAEFFVLLTFLACTQTALALDRAQPATLHISVTDPAGKPIPAASLRLQNSPKPAAPTLSDPAGKATLTSPPDGKIFWHDQLLVEKTGYAPQTLPVNLFVGADLDQPLVLQRAHTTLIHVTTLDNKPVPNAELSMSYTAYNQRFYGPFSDSLDGPKLRVDDHGNYLWVHGPAPDGLIACSGVHMEWFNDAPEITLQLTDPQVAQSSPHELAARLLLADGSPAAGWYVGNSMMTMGFSSGGLMFFSYQVPKLLSVASDGTFAIPDAQTNLFAVSPQGVPIMYTLNPSVWEPGQHHLTLTLPKMTSTKSSQVLDSNNQPLPALRVFPKSFQTFGRSWDFSVAGSTAGLPVNDRGDILSVLTDAQGRFAIPLPFGTSTGIATNRDGWSLNPDPKSDDYHFRPISNIFSHGGIAMPFKEIIFHTVDPSGHAVDLPGNLYPQPFVGNRQAILAGSISDPDSASDKRGIHLFVEPAADTIKIHFAGGYGDLWKPFDQTLPLTGTADQQLTVSLTADPAYYPLDGTVLDAAGKPATHRSIFVALKGQPPWINHSTTDDQGRFHLAGVPANATIEVFGPEYYDWNNLSPGFLPATPINGQVKMELHLNPIGKVRIVLPKTFTRPLTLASLQPQLAPTLEKSALLHFDPDTKTLESRSVIPGLYHLDRSAFPDFPDLADARITVEPGKETLLDLSAHPYTPLQERWATFQILSSGKPLSGTQVAVFSEEPNSAASSPLTQLTRDLSDDQGLIRFRAAVGKQYVAVAHVLGQSAGWQSLTLTPAQQPPATNTTVPNTQNTPATLADATLELRPVRTLTMPVLNDNMYQVKLIYTTPAGIEALALAQFNADAWLTSSTYLHRENNQLVLHDLPVGVECELQPESPASFPPQHLQITPGEGPLNFSLGNQK